MVALAAVGSAGVTIMVVVVVMVAVMVAIMVLLNT